MARLGLNEGAEKNPMKRITITTKRRGFTLLELLIVVAILGLLSAYAMPGYQDYVDQTDNSVAIQGLVIIEGAIERYMVDTNTLPPDLDSIGMGGFLDPWDNPYPYVPFDADTKKGEKRKDKNLNPVNTDYDLYSMGKNQTTAKPFTSAPGRDDLVRANNGRFHGLASDH